MEGHLNFVKIFIKEKILGILYPTSTGPKVKVLRSLEHHINSVIKLHNLSQITPNVPNYPVVRYIIKSNLMMTLSGTTFMHDY